jgi:hypothetical protein
MSLLMQFRGDVKQCKTLSAVYYIKTRFYARGWNIFTNLEECTYRGNHWAETVKLDELLADLLKPPDQAKYKLGVLFIDEAHVYWSAENNAGHLGGLTTALLTQAGKRGLVVIYTTHINGMVGPRVRELTTVTIKCKTPDEGRTVFWDVTDLKALRDALDEGKQPPRPIWHILHEGWRQWSWYNCNEVVDPFSTMRSLAATRRGKQLVKALSSVEGGGITETPAAQELKKDFQEFKQDLLNENRALMHETFREFQKPVNPRGSRAGLD